MIHSEKYVFFVKRQKAKTKIVPKKRLNKKTNQPKFYPSQSEVALSMSQQPPPTHKSTATGLASKT